MYRLYIGFLALFDLRMIGIYLFIYLFIYSFMYYSIIIFLIIIIIIIIIIICLFVLRFNVPVNNFSVMLGRSHRYLGIKQYSGELMCFAQGHNTVILVGIEPMTSRFEVRRSTTRPPRPLLLLSLSSLLLLSLLLDMRAENPKPNSNKSEFNGNSSY